MMLLNHLPALLVVVPLLLAPLVAVIPGASYRTAYFIAALTAIVTFVIACLIVHQVSVVGPLSYEMGNWPVPFGIGFLITPFASAMALIVAGGSAFAFVWGRESFLKEVPGDHQPLLLACWLLATAGLLGIVVTADAFNAFVFMEISSLASYVLVAGGPKRTALTASFKYLVTGSLGATFYLIGVGYLYMMTGTLNFADLTDRLSDVSETSPVLIASGFIMLGLALKAAVFPMHAWMPAAYQFAPTPVAIFFAASSTKVALFLLIKFDYLVLQPNLSDHAFLFSTILMPMATLAFLVGSSVAIFSKDLKRMLGYSSVAQIGYILIASSLVTSAGLTAAIVHIFNHALIKSALFMAVGCLFWRFGTSNIQDLAGAAKVMPITMAGFVVAGLSLIGVPLTAGFISKVTLIQALLELGSLGFILLSLVLISSLMAVIYIWRVVEVTYFGKPAESMRGEAKGEAPWPMLVTLWILVIANIYFGIEPSLPLGLADAEVKLLLGGPQE